MNGQNSNEFTKEYEQLGVRDVEQLVEAQARGEDLWDLDVRIETQVPDQWRLDQRVSKGRGTTSAYGP